MINKKKIFIVEDDETAMTSLKKMLEISDFLVGATRNPKEAIEKIRGFKPDIILLDLLMPNMGGLDVCELLNKDPAARDIPIIIISALSNEEDIKKAYKLGVVDYFTKPYEFEKLLRQINKTIAYKEKQL